MDTTLRKATIENFRGRVASIEPTPAGVAVCAISASLGLGLLEKVLRITGQRRDFSGDRVRLLQLCEAAQDEGRRLAQCADDDTAAFNEYLACRRLPKDTLQQREERARAIDAALRRATDIPLMTARRAVAGLDLCADAAGFVHEFVSADLSAATVLLASAVRATLLSVEFNIGQLPRDSEYYRDILAERKDLQNQAIRKSDAILEQIAARNQESTI